MARPKKENKRKPLRLAPCTWRDKSLRDMTKKEVLDAKKRLAEGWRAELPTLQLYSFTGLDEERIKELKRRDPSLASLEEGYKDYLKTMSRLNVARDIIEDADIQTSKWYLEHTDDEFKPASKVEKGVQIIVPVEQREKEIEKMLDGFFEDLNEGFEDIAGEQDGEPSELDEREDTSTL